MPILESKVKAPYERLAEEYELPGGIEIEDTKEFWEEASTMYPESSAQLGERTKKSANRFMDLFEAQKADTVVVHIVVSHAQFVCACVNEFNTEGDEKVKPGFGNFCDISALRFDAQGCPGRPAQLLKASVDHLSIEIEEE
jgi:hypothetical protein